MTRMQLDNITENNFLCDVDAVKLGKGQIIFPKDFVFRLTRSKFIMTIPNLMQSQIKNMGRMTVRIYTIILFLMFSVF